MSNQPKKGDILQCGGVVTFVAATATGYYFTPKGGGSRQWVATQPPKTAGVAIDYAAVIAAQDADEKERERERTPQEIAAWETARMERDAATIARCGPIETAALAAVPKEDRHQWLANLGELKKTYGHAAVEMATVYGRGNGHTVRTRSGWAWETSVVTYSGGGSGYGRHAD